MNLHPFHNRSDSRLYAQRLQTIGQYLELVPVEALRRIILTPPISWGAAELCSPSGRYRCLMGIIRNTQPDGTSRCELECNLELAGINIETTFDFLYADHGVSTVLEIQRLASDILAQRGLSNQIL